MRQYWSNGCSRVNGKATATIGKAQLSPCRLGIDINAQEGGRVPKDSRKGRNDESIPLPKRGQEPRRGEEKAREEGHLLGDGEGEETISRLGVCQGGEVGEVGAERGELLGHPLLLEGKGANKGG